MTELEKNIDDYINDRLALSEKIAFEDLLRNDENLRKDVEAYIDIQNILKDSSAPQISNNESIKGKAYLEMLMDEKGEQIQTSISNAQEKYFNEMKRKERKRKVNYLALAVLFALLLALFYWLSQSKTSNQELFASYKEYSRLPSFVIRSEQVDLARGEKLFNEQKYQKAIEIFDDYLDNDNSNFNSQILLYKACSLMELDKYVEAIDILTPLSNGTNMDSGIAKWYLALASIKINEKENALKYLEDISSEAQNFKSQEAKALLKTLQ